jgi:hypothetical protein
MTPDQQRKYEELLQRAMQRNPNMVSPEQVQAIEAAMGLMQQGGGAGFNPLVIQNSDGAAAQQSDALDPQSGWPQPSQPQADPYTERQFEFAKDDLRRWMAQYEPYRGKGQFAALEAIFEMARRVTG